MVKELHQNSQPLVAGEFFVEVAVGLFSFSEAAKFFRALLHEKNINLAAPLSERISSL
jgi:hypothetical protein